MAAIDADTFREDFPEFASDGDYPTSQVDGWLAIAYDDLNAARFGKMLNRAAELFTAHHLVLGRRAQKAAAGGGVPGLSVGVVNNRSVDKVSVGYDVSTLTDKGSGHWGLTTYGMQFWWLLRQRCLGLVYRAPTPGFTAW